MPFIRFHRCSELCQKARNDAHKNHTVIYCHGFNNLDDAIKQQGKDMEDMILALEIPGVKLEVKKVEWSSIAAEVQDYVIKRFKIPSNIAKFTGASFFTTENDVECAKERETAR